jgi:selenophosphate synthetase-related protein
MTQSRLFMIQDIVAMGNWNTARLDVLEAMTDEALYAIWLNLVNLSTKELTQ